MGERYLDTVIWNAVDDSTPLLSAVLVAIWR
jgi:hypothetical protein